MLQQLTEEHPSREAILEASRQKSHVLALQEEKEVKRLWKELLQLQIQKLQLKVAHASTIYRTEI